MINKFAILPLTLMCILALSTAVNLQLVNALPPTEITIISPDTKTTYNNDSIALVFTAQTYGTFEMDGRKWGWAVVKFSYSLDNQANVSIGLSNATLNNLSQGQHTLVIHAERELLLNGFLGAGTRDNFSSNCITFDVEPTLAQSVSPSVPEFSFLAILPILLTTTIALAIVRKDYKKSLTSEN
jgi:hypothetical protein